MDSAIKSSDRLNDAIAAELGSDVMLNANHYTSPTTYQTVLAPITHLSSLPEKGTNVPPPSPDDVSDGSNVVYTVDVTVIVVR